MQKTITAQFDSVDAATFAVRRVTDHFGDIQSVRISYKNIGDGHEEEPYLFSDAFTPLSYAVQPIVNGIMSPFFNQNVIREREQQEAHRTAVQKVTVRIHAAGSNANAIGSTLRFGGGNRVKVE